jgi:hypothetical protein
MRENLKSFAAMRKFLGPVILPILLLVQLTMQAQPTARPATPPTSVYNSHEAFGPLFYPAYGDEYRSADGGPGPRYWQNSADYKIDASLDDENKSLSGTVLITYKNNSPQDLPFVWLQLDQNIQNPNSRGVAITDLSGGRWANRDAFEGGYQLKSVELIDPVTGKGAPADYLVSDTRMKIKLPAGLRSGGSLKMKIAYSFNIPQYGTDRMGRLETKNGWI